MAIFWIIFIPILVALAMAVGLQNLDLIVFNVAFWEINVSIGILVIVSFIVGLLIPVLLLLPNLMTARFQNKKLKEENKKMKSRLDDSGIMFESGGLGTEGEKYKHE